jgi:1,4-alpha-glucan branching enzyme
MLKKSYSKTGRSCRVTFDLPTGINANTATLCGDFNAWNPEANPMKMRKDGSFSTTVTVSTGQTYRFKYLLDRQWWENDWAADGYVPNKYGTEDSLLKL